MRMMLILMDTDGDGAVSLSEFQAAHDRIFKAIDADKDGKLTIQEARRFVLGFEEEEDDDNNNNNNNNNNDK